MVEPWLLSKQVITISSDMPRSCQGVHESVYVKSKKWKLGFMAGVESSGRPFKRRFLSLPILYPEPAQRYSRDLQKSTSEK